MTHQFRSSPPCARGEVLNIRATGTYTVGSWFDETLDPSGYPGDEARSYNLASFKNQPHACAIAMIGRDHNIEGEVVGSARAFVASHTGTLSVGLNDSDLDNNQGLVRYDIERRAPKLQRTRVLQWLAFEPTNVDGVISRARFRRTFPDVVPTRPEEFTVWLRDGQRALCVLDDHLRTRTFLVGEALTIADLALYSYVHCAHEGGFNLAPLAAIRRWCERIESRPAHLRIDTTPPLCPGA